MNENDTTKLCDPENMDRQYFVKNDEQKLSPNTCGPRMIITCLVVQALAFGICLIVLIAYVSNATRPIANMSQAELQKSELTSRLSSCEDANDTVTNQLEEAMTMVKSHEEKIQRLMAQVDTFTGSSSKQIRVSRMSRYSEIT